MKGALVLLVTIAVVCLMIRMRYRSKKLPPKAQLVCDIWNAVEGSEEEYPGPPKTMIYVK